MPLRVRVTLQGPKPSSPHAHADGLRAIVLSAVTRSNPALGDWLHNANQPKPLAVGPLLTHDETDGIHSVEISCTADDLCHLLVASLPSPGSTLRLGTCRYEVRDLRPVAQVTFEELYWAPPPGRVIGVHLLTPTAHHAAGERRRAVVVPDSQLYFGSWLGRWNLSSTIRFGETTLDALREFLVISAFQGGTSAIQLSGKRLFIGFRGTVEFTLLRASHAADAVLEAAWALARFAEFCSTGVETMRGMGWTRLARRSRPGLVHATSGPADDSPG